MHRTATQQDARAAVADAARAATRRASCGCPRGSGTAAAGRPPRSCVRSEVECQSALRNVRRAGRRARRSRPLFQRFHFNRAPRAQGNGIMLARHRKDTMRRSRSLAALGSRRCSPPRRAAAAARILSRERRRRAEGRARVPRRCPIRAVAREYDAPPLRRAAPPRLRRRARRTRSGSSAQFREFGLDAHIETFESCSRRRRSASSSSSSPTPFRAALAETPVEDDPTSGQTAAQLPTYNAYSIDGDVTAPLVYVNYGVPDDYEKLETLGVDVQRQDRASRGMAEAGAASSRRSPPSTAPSAA